MRAVEHDWFAGMGIDSHDEHRPLRPALAGQPGGDGGVPLRLPGAARRRIHFERRRTHSAAHAGRILSGTDDSARPLHMVGRRPIPNTSTVGSDRTSPWPGRSGKDAGKQFGRGRASYLGRGRRSGRCPDDQISLGHIQPGIKQAGDDTDQPRIACRSATTKDQRSLARGARPPYGAGLLVGPRSAAVPWRVERGDREPVADPLPDPSPATARRARDTSPGAYLCRPPPWPVRSRGAPSVADSGDHGTPLMSPSVKVRSAMPSEAVVEVKCGVEEGVVFMGVAFRELPVGRSRWRLPQSRDRGLQGSTHCGYCVHGSHLLPMDHDRRNARTPATRCATGITPVAVSLSNAPPTATPSSVMSPQTHPTVSP